MWELQRSKISFCNMKLSEVSLVKAEQFNMKKRQIKMLNGSGLLDMKKQSPIKLPPEVGLGTFRSKSQDVKVAVRCALQHGIKHIDTASIYKASAHQLKRRISQLMLININRSPPSDLTANFKLFYKISAE